ncbi:MAG: TetR/AcrR family transcriptional regulator [Spirochaetales bacterium]|nr:TetR/AcrR family transcriptional regulator [Spirochaetales bacterium]
MDNLPCKHEDIKDIIIRAAKDIFARFGFKKTTMEDIANAVHKGKSSLYYYFKSKEDVFKAVIEKESSILNSEIVKAVSQEETPQEKLRAYAVTRMRILNNLAVIYNSLKGDLYQYTCLNTSLRKKYLNDELKMVEKILKNGVDMGILMIKDIEMTSSAIITALKGLEYSLIIGPDTSKTENEIENLLNILFYGMVKNNKVKVM